MLPFNIIAKKIGMTRLFDDSGLHVVVTVLQLCPVHIVGVRTLEKDGYSALQLGAFDVKAHKLSKPLRCFFEKNAVIPVKKIWEVSLLSDLCSGLPEIGNEVKWIPEKDDVVDVQSFSKGKGFAGCMKRHNFGGLGASHGVSVTHRSPGSTGQRQDPGKVFKGKKMPGHLGNKLTTIQRLSVVDFKNNFVFLKGAVPGANNNFVKIAHSIKDKIPSNRVIFSSDKN